MPYKILMNVYNRVYTHIIDLVRVVYKIHPLISLEIFYEIGLMIYVSGVYVSIKS